ncbi:MAG TPA: SDR family NAD(P)-dependent oxidoreductase [Candidatus Methylomirabilis sp.]|nr:SDR family NAD(P)-dependent oxidoreductase [Candidatus Methylomirabilis sp.]
MGVELTGRVAIVTGAAQGIGEATVKKLAERGAIVVGLDKQGDLLKEQMAGMTQGVAMVVDVTDALADQQAVKAIHERFGRIDILVNVAGGTLGAARGVDTLTVADWHRVMDLNLHAPFYLSLAVAPIMKAQRWGRIITVGSGAGRSVSRSRIVPYAAAKAGAHGLMRQLAVELAPFNVLCNVVAPGFVLSPHGVADWARRSDAEKQMEMSTIAIKRLGDASEIANVIAFVASEEAGYVVGQTIMVDGGHWMF